MNAQSGPIPVRTLAFLGAACFASMASLRAADPILPEIAKAFFTTPGDAAKIVTVFGVCYAVMQFIYGFAGDRYGHLRVIVITTILSGLSTLLCAVATSLNMLMLGRILVGLTAAAIIPLSFAWLADVVPYERRQAVLAYFLSGQLSGLILGQVFSGVIAEHFSWRVVFVLLAAFFLIAGAALLFEMRRHEFVVRPLEGSPLGRLVTLVRRPWVQIVLVSVLLDGLLFFGAFTFVGSFLWARFGIGLDLVGLIVAGFGVGAMMYSMTAGRMLPYLGEGGLALGGGIVIALAFLLLAFAPAVWFALPATILAGFGYYMLHNTLQTNATQMAPQSRGLAISTFASCLFLGQAIGVAVTAPVFDDTGGQPIFLAAGVLLLILGAAFRSLLAYRG
jgi:MFS transporter, YNFM family, putative membrane transport protein